MTAPVLSVSGVAKRFCRDLRRSLRYGVVDIVGELVPGVADPSHLRPDEFWALDDISFEVRPGEALAVVGHNGAGKSTLLKLLCGLLKPDRGTIRIEGAAEALIELGTGLNPLLSGRENIVLGAALRGVSGAAVRRLIDDVVEFAELGEFLDAPLQSYSAGMRARLAYGLSAHLRPGLFLVDEVLAVGDLAFQHKCLRQMRSYIADGGALLLVSHNVHQIQAVCERGILLSRGRLIFEGATPEVLNRLLDERPVNPIQPDAPARLFGPVEILGLTARADGSAGIGTGDAVELVLSYRADERVEAICGISFWTADQWICVASAWDREGRVLEPGAGEIRCRVPRLPLLAGRYVVRAAILDRDTRHPLAHFGHEGPGLSLQLTSRADPITNLQLLRGHLIELEADWGAAPSGAAAP